MKLSIVCLLIVFACAMAAPSPEFPIPKSTLMSMADHIPFFGTLMKSGVSAYDRVKGIMKSGLSKAKTVVKSIG